MDIDGFTKVLYVLAAWVGLMMVELILEWLGGVKLEGAWWGKLLYMFFNAAWAVFIWETIRKMVKK